MYPPYTLPFAKMYINNSENLTPGVNQFPHVSSAETETHNHFCHKSAQPFDLPGFSRQKSDCLKCRKLFQGNSMLIRLLFIQRNTINLNYFLAISKNRYQKLKFDIPNPITILTSFRKDVDTLNKCLHKLFLFNIRTFCI